MNVIERWLLIEEHERLKPLLHKAYFVCLYQNACAEEVKLVTFETQIFSFQCIAMTHITLILMLQKQKYVSSTGKREGLEVGGEERWEKVCEEK